MGQVFHFEFSHARIKIAVHVGSVGVMISKLVIDPILTFEDSEEEILNHIVSYISTETKAFQVVENARTELRFDGLEIDVAKRLVRKQKQEIDLTFTEFEILHLLARNPGRVFSKEQIYNSVWKEPYFGDYNIVMSHIRNIREKIEDNPSKPIYIQTVWGVGYKFNNKLK